MLVKLKPSFSEMSQCLPAVWPICKQLCCWCQPEPPRCVSPCVCLLAHVLWEQNVASCFNTHLWMLERILGFCVCRVCRWPWCQVVWRAVRAVVPRRVCVCAFHGIHYVCLHLCLPPSLVCVWHLIWRADRLKDMCCNCCLTVFML